MSTTIVRTLGLNRPPLSVDGDKHVVGPDPVAGTAWAGHPNEIATCATAEEAGWTFAVQEHGATVFVRQGAKYFGFNTEAAPDVWERIKEFGTAFRKAMEVDQEEAEGALYDPAGAAAAVQTAAFARTPAGVMFPYGGAAATAGFVLCDGTSYLRAGTYAALFAVIGTAYGSVDGTHFNVPDARGRALYGLGTHSDVNGLGDNDGVTVADRTPLHVHDEGALTANTPPDAVNVAAAVAAAGTSFSTAAHLHDTTILGVTGPTSPGHLVVNYIIKI